VAVERLPGKVFRVAPMGLTPESVDPPDDPNATPPRRWKATDQGRDNSPDPPNSRYNTDRNVDRGTEGLIAIFEIREIGGAEGRALSVAQAQAVRAVLEWAARQRGDWDEQEAA
jgi:hypothetical protein